MKPEWTQSLAVVLEPRLHSTEHYMGCLPSCPLATQLSSLNPVPPPWILVCVGLFQEPTGAAAEQSDRACCVPICHVTALWGWITLSTQTHDIKFDQKGLSLKRVNCVFGLHTLPAKPAGSPSPWLRQSSGGEAGARRVRADVALLLMKT